jgi:hypothetical protein
LENNGGANGLRIAPTDVTEYSEGRGGPATARFRTIQIYPKDIAGKAMFQIMGVAGAACEVPILGRRRSCRVQKALRPSNQ